MLDSKSVEELLRHAHQEYKVPIQTLRRWYLHFKETGEYPYKTKAQEKRFHRLYKKCKMTTVITTEIMQFIKECLDEHPEYYLDEFQSLICKHLHLYISIPTIYRILVDKLGYSLHVCYEAAAQRNEAERCRYKAALESLVTNADQVIFVDESHKDRRASRRRRAWGLRNKGGVALRRWFKTSVIYTMIAAMAINGFITSSIDCLKTGESEEDQNTVDS